MAKVDGRRGEPRPGRKTDSTRTESILTVTSEVLFERGYDNLRVQEVAERAGVGTGAIYRRWETKEALVAEAIRSGPDPTPAVLATGDAEADLALQVRGKAEMAASRPDLLPGLIAAMRAHPVIDDAIRERYTVAPLREAVAEVLGSDHPAIDLVTELVPAVALHRTTLLGKGIDPDAFTQEVLRLVALLTPPG